MALTLIQEPLQFAPDAYAAHGDTLRAPCVAVVGGQDLRRPQHIVEVIHRLTLSHKHNVRQRIALRQGIDLIQDIACRETALEALFSRLTEQAIHLTAHLTRYTKRCTITVGDIHRFYKLA